MILFTSATEKNRQQAGKIALIYLLCSIFCAVFGAVYECFSHGVYSYYMLYAFLLPLVAGTLPFTVIGLYCPDKIPGNSSRCFYHFGIATLTVGCIMQGILEIYGTTNQKIYFYPVTGLGLVLLAALHHKRCANRC